MDVNDLRSAVTVFSFLLFIGLMTWTWWPRRQRAYEEAARLPFDGETSDPEHGALQ